MTKLKNSVILITGASGGFGQEFIKQLLLEESLLILTDINHEKLLSFTDNIVSEAQKKQIIACLEADLSTRLGCEQLYQKIQDLQLSIDILINNAGIGLYGRIDEVPITEWEKLMQVNLLSPMTLTALFLPSMIERKQGHIVNISSLAGWVGLMGMSHYASSKFGLRGFSEALDREVKPYNVKVTAVYPYFSRTPLLQAKAYGTLAENYQGFPSHLATNPETIVQGIIIAIKENKLHLFPDIFAFWIHLLRRYLPMKIFDFILQLTPFSPLKNEK